MNTPLVPVLGVLVVVGLVILWRKDHAKIMAEFKVLKTKIETALSKL